MFPVKTFLIAVLVLFNLCLVHPVLAAKFAVDQIISDHMILQRDRPVKLVGSSTPGAAVQATLGETTVATVTGANGRWEIALPPRPLGAPFSISVQSLGQKVQAHDVLAGDVFLCAGQTSMQLPVSESSDCKNLEIAMPEQTRFYSVDEPGRWISVSSEELSKKSALAVAFVSVLRKLMKNVPVGVVQCTVGNANLHSWIASKDLPEKSGKKNTTEPGAVFDKYLFPMSGLPFKAVIWYQGENDLPSFNSYPLQFALLTKSWRKRFSADMPFFVVQLPRWGGKNIVGDNSPLAYFREAQQKACLAPHCYLVPTINAPANADWANLRNPDKFLIGHNCAQIVAGRVYRSANALIPRFASAERVGPQLKVTFSIADSGLELKDKKTRAFAIAGEDGEFKTAKVMLENNVVFLTSAAVHLPVYCRYGWADNMPPALFSKNGMPVAPFRTDTIPLTGDLGAKVLPLFVQH